MRNGYDKDDIYIMVEDEFQTVAQSYTAHLHHAEYRRLMREARTAPSKNLPEPTSPMSNEAKRRLQSAALQRRQSDVLHQVTGKASTVQDEEDKISDLWSGTSLAPLMVQSSQQKTSLVGLERISSTTRAGSGYSRPKSSGGQVSNEELGNREEHTSVGPGSYSRLDGRAQHDQRTSDRTNQKFLPRSISVVTQQRTEQRLTSTSSIHDIDDETSGEGNNLLGKRKPNENSIRPKAQALGSTFMKRKRDKEKEKQSRLDEVPLFIIWIFFWADSLEPDLIIIPSEGGTDGSGAVEPAE
jgi:hypothetical protein